MYILVFSSSTAIETEGLRDLATDDPVSDLLSVFSSFLLKIPRGEREKERVRE
jgi:hypothetical protein